MRTSPLRPYVIQLMNDYQLHTFQDILDSANSYFSETPYTEKQLHYLVRNLKRSGIIMGDKKKGYRKIAIQQTVSPSNATPFPDESEDIAMSSYIANMKKCCLSLKRSFDAPMLFTRLEEQSIDPDWALKVYKTNEQILALLENLESPDNSKNNIL